jgi:acetyl-CoA carboxylase carboxyl transferase subunit alpha
MNPNFLDFEQPIADLEAKIAELGKASTGQSVNIDAEVEGLREKLRVRTAEIFHSLTPWQISQLARHPQRPYTLDYLGLICDEFHELAGDRAFADDAAIVGGLARISGRSCVVIGQQKGRDTKSKIKRNFGMPRPAPPVAAAAAPTVRFPDEPELPRFRTTHRRSRGEDPGTRPRQQRPVGQHRR